MGSALRGTVIITGGNGSLGSETALAIATAQPFVHLLLTARNLASESVKQVSEKLRALGPRSFEIAKVDLASFASVKAFAAHTVDRVTRKEIPPVEVLLNSAAASSFVVDNRTADGYDLVYQTNCLSPFLLTVSLLEAFRDKRAGGGGKVINVGSAAIGMGRLDYFQTQNALWEKKKGTQLGTKEGLTRYGSSKLRMNAAMYALRRSLVIEGNIPIDIFTLDPGGMSGNSNLSQTTPTVLKIVQRILALLRPLVRLVAKSAINDPSVPAKALAQVAFETEAEETIGHEKYFVLDDEYEVEAWVPAAKDDRKMDDVLKTTIKEVKLDMEENRVRYGRRL